MDSTTLTADKVELATISRDETDGGRVRSLPYPTPVRRWNRNISQMPAFIVFRALRHLESAPNVESGILGIRT